MSVELHMETIAEEIKRIRIILAVIGTHLGADKLQSQTEETPQR